MAQKQAQKTKQNGKKGLLSHATYFSRNALLKHVIISNLNAYRLKRLRNMI